VLKKAFPFACLSLLLLPVAHAAGPTFKTRKDIPSGFTAVRSVAVADFNGDGKPDLAVVGSSESRVAIFPGTGLGNFGSPISTQVQNTADATGLGSVIAGDFDEDGKQDLIVSRSDGNVTGFLLLGKGDGTFTQSPATVGNCSSMTAVDLNSDSHLDLVCVGNPLASVLIGDGKGNFTQKNLVQFPNVSLYGILSGVATGDFNRDDKLDLLASYEYTDTGRRAALVFYAGNGDGTFQTPAVQPAAFGMGDVYTAAADFNGDGRIDLIAGTYNIAFINFGNGDGTFNQSINTSPILSLPGDSQDEISPYPPRVAAADLNGDKLVDAVAADPYSKLISVFLNDGTGTFQQAQPDFSAALAGAPGFSVITRDVNGDGLPDLLILDVTNQQISIFASAATPTMTLTGSSNSVIIGSPFSATVKVAGPASNTIIPTGKVTLSDGSNSLGTATLDSTGSATISLPSLSVGQHVLTASYPGDSIYTAATSGSFTVTVTQHPTPTITLTSSATSVLVGAPVSVTIAAASTAGTPTGTVTLGEGANTLGQQTLSGGIASIQLSNLAAGAHTIAASYSGDSTFAAAMSSSNLPVSVTDVTVSLTTSTQRIASGASASYTVNLAPVGGFNGTVSLSCTGLPAGYSCANSSTTVTGSATTANLVVSPTKAAFAAPFLNEIPTYRIAAITSASMFFVWLLPRRKRSAGRLLLLICATLLLGISGCSGGGGSSGPAPYTGTTNFTITATLTQGSQTATHTTTATLVVQ
jgi:hypothetical protein